jgi:uncharacterized membrane protein
MAFCPKCNGVLDEMALICPHCGFDFPSTYVERRNGIEFSRLADVALMVAALVTGVGCAAAVIGVPIAIVNGQWLTALIGCPIAFLYQLALLVVFVRVGKLQRPQALASGHEG